jgi:hypothetical protein
MPTVAERFAVTRSVIVAPQAGKIECVNKVSWLRKAGIVARVAGEQAGRSRTVNALWAAARTTARSFGHVLHQLWLEVAGVIFLIMALSLAGKTAQEYGKYHAGQVGLVHVALAVGFTLTFAWFGLSSFWRAHKKKQRS